MTRKTLLLSLMVLASLFSFSQKHKHKHKKATETETLPRVWLGNIHTWYSTRDSILAHPIVNTDSAGCRVSGFTVSLQAPGHDFYGPLYSTTWEMTQVQKDAIRNWNYPNTTLFIQDIHLNCHERDAVTNPFKIMFDK